MGSLVSLFRPQSLTNQHPVVAMRQRCIFICLLVGRLPPFELETVECKLSIHEKVFLPALLQSSSVSSNKYQHAIKTIFQLIWPYFFLFSVTLIRCSTPANLRTLWVADSDQTCSAQWMYRLSSTRSIRLSASYWMRNWNWSGKDVAFVRLCFTWNVTQRLEQILYLSLLVIH